MAVRYLDLEAGAQRHLKIEAEIAQTATLVIYGAKGMGKTNLGGVLCEAFAGVGLHFVVLDGLDNWWGLKFGADGKSDGLPVLILGGRYGDIAITPNDGVVCADLVVDERANVVVAMAEPTGKLWSHERKAKFVADFCERLFERQGEKPNPIMVVIEEAGRLVPQQIMGARKDDDRIRCLIAIEQLVELGRNKGIGVTLITQRSARMAKSVSELADIMIAFRTVGPRSKAAVAEWLDDNIDVEDPKEAAKATARLIYELRRLPVGQALVVSPGLLNVNGVQVTFRKRGTFDASATPKGRARALPTGGARVVDLDKYKTRMQETNARALASDPRSLQDRVKRLEAEGVRRAQEIERKDVEIARLMARPLAKAEKTKPVPALKAADLQRLERVAQKLVDAGQAYANLTLIVSNVGSALVEGIRQASAAPRAASPSTSPAPLPASPPPIRRGPTREEMAQSAQRAIRPSKPIVHEFTITPRDEDARRSLTRREQQIADVIATLASRGIELPSKVQVATWIGMAGNGGGFNNYLGKMKTAGLIAYPREGFVTLTPEGRSIAQADDALDTATIHARLREAVKPALWRVLEPILAAYGQPVEKADLAASLNPPMSVDGGGFNNYLGKLRTMGLIEYPAPGQVQASAFCYAESAA